MAPTNQPPPIPKVKLRRLAPPRAAVTRDELLTGVRASILKYGYSHIARSILDTYCRSFRDADHETFCNHLAEELDLLITYSQFMVTFVPKDTRFESGLVIAGNNPTEKELKEHAKLIAKSKSKAK